MKNKMQKHHKNKFIDYKDEKWNRKDGKKPVEVEQEVCDKDENKQIIWKKNLVETEAAVCIEAVYNEYENKQKRWKKSRGDKSSGVQRRWNKLRRSKNKNPKGNMKGGIWNIVLFSYWGSGIRKGKNVFFLSYENLSWVVFVIWNNVSYSCQLHFYLFFCWTLQNRAWNGSYAYLCWMRVWWRDTSSGSHGEAS